MKNPQKPTIKVERRRPGSSAPSGPRERAEAPQRERERTQGSAPSGGGAYTGGSGAGQVPSGGGFKLPTSPMGWGIMIVLVICFVAYSMISGGGGGLVGGAGDGSSDISGDGSDPGFETGPVAAEPNEPAAPPRPTATRRPTQPPSAAGGAQTWTVMLYQDADDKVLEQDIYVDLNEAERVGSGGNLNIVAQIDRYQAGFSGDGDWTGTRRYYVQPDDDLTTVASDMVQDLGEANMADGDTLVDFITWAAQNYPADKYILILSDHGMGWPGGWSDPTSTGRDSHPMQSALGDNLFLNELDDALDEARQQSGIEKFELVGMDACLMGHLEVMSALAPHSRYSVLSQEVEPALGWAYTSFLTQLSQNPGLTGGELGQIIVDSYIVDDQRILDDTARAEMVGRGSPFGSLFGAASVPSAAQMVRQFEQNVTLTAADLQALPALIESVNQLAVSLQDADQRYVAQARSYSQSFTNIFGKEVPPAYIDLLSFADLAARSAGKRSIADAAALVRQAMGQVVIAEKHGPRISDASGVSIYFPNSTLFQARLLGPETYTVVADRFADESLWDEFLVFHYTGETFDLDTRSAAVPSGSVRAPAAGGIEVSAVTASAGEVSVGDTVELSVDLQGENIGYVKLLVGFLDTNANSIYLADSDFLSSPETRQEGNVFYPEWGVDAFTLSFDWEPIVYAINDGTARYPALFTPEVYGASGEQAVYSVEGIYTFADSGDQRPARLYFANGVLQQVFTFTPSSSTGAGESAGAPHEAIPQSGDQFTILDKWMDLNDQGQVVDNVRQAGQTLTFGETMFTWEVMDAAAGQYVVGFIIEDLDGNSQVAFAPVTVR